MLELSSNDSPSAQAATGSKEPGCATIDPAKLTAVGEMRPRIRAYLRRVIRDRAEREQAVSDVLSETLMLQLNPRVEESTIWPAVLRVLRRIAREEWRRSREVGG